MTRQDGGDHADIGFQSGDQGACWLDDRFANISASSLEVSGFQDGPPLDADSLQSVIFHGDGRSIILSSIMFMAMPKWWA